MKKAATLIALVLLGYFFASRLRESPDPSYMRFQLQMPVESTEVAVTVLEKLPPHLDCEAMANRQTGFTQGFLDACDGCLLISQQCMYPLSGNDRILFDDRVTSRPYFSYEKGGLLTQQDFRVLFPDLSESALGALCIDLSKQLRRTPLFFLGGKTECVRPSEE
ncbi:MAG: hypothetical protein AAF657_23520 [Acidobacteriota bacterium]